MKKIMLSLFAFCLCSAGFAAQPADTAASDPVNKEETAAAPVTPAAPQAKKDNLTTAEQKKAFKARQKRIKKLVKQYRKASEAEKPAIKAQLSEVVSQSVDAGMAYVKARIAAERANLDNWEAKLQENEQNLAQIKARRVEDLLSGEAERRHKAAQKKWKKQMKEAEKKMD